MNAPKQAEPTAPLGQSLPFDPAELWLQLRRQKWLILLSTLVVGLAVTAYAVRQPKVYQAKAQLLIEPVMPKILGELDPGNLNEHVRSERAFYNTQYMIIISQVVLTQVASSPELNLAQDADFLEAHDLSVGASARDISKALLKSLNVQPERGSRVVNLVVEDPDPNRAAKIANVVADTYVEYSLESRVQNNKAAEEWLDHRVVEFKRQLEGMEQKLHQFKEENLLVSVSLEDRQNMTAANMTMLNQKLLETRSQLIELQAKQQTVEEVEDRFAAVQQIGSSNVIDELRSNLVKLDKQRADLTTRYGPKHPSMVALLKQIAKAQEDLDKEVRRVLGSLHNEIATLKRTETELQKAMAQEKQRALELNRVGLEYTNQNRNVGTTKQMYESLLKRQTETALAGLLKSNFARIFEKAEPVMTPVRPSVTKNAALGFGAGFLLGILLILARSLLDNTIHSRSDIEDLLHLPYLGVYPKVGLAEKISSPQRDLYVHQNPKSSAAECARGIRTNLVFMGTDKPIKRLLLTSARPREGKTSMVVTMGVTMAQAGHRVIILDTDLRKPRLHKAFGVSGEVGLTSVLAQQKSLEEAVKSTELVKLEILPCGPTPPNPAELLHSERFTRLLDELSEKYDRILLDSPPIGMVTDAAILSKLADGTILVVRANETPKETARRSVRQLEHVDAHFLGVVLNDVDLRKGTYGYGYGYGYGDEAEV